MTLRQLNKFLACPVCRHQLQFKSILICSHCHRRYLVKSGIPILLPDLKQQEKSQQQIFNQRYQQDFHLHPWHQSMLYRLFNHPFLQKGQVYLDIGCGPTGYTVKAAAQKKLIAIGLDISYTAALSAQKRLKNLPNAAIVVASAQHLPFKKSTFDYISAISVIEHLKNPRLDFSVLKKHGHLFLVVPNSYRQIPLIIRPLKRYFDQKIGHLHDFTLTHLKRLYQPLKLQKHFYNGHWLKFIQIIFAKLIPASLWWQIEKHDINNKPYGVQLNALFQKS